MSLKDWFRSKCSCFWSKPNPEKIGLLPPNPKPIALTHNNTSPPSKDNAKLDKKNDKYNLNIAPDKFLVPNIGEMEYQEKTDLYDFVSAILNKVLERGCAITPEQQQVITENSAVCENAFITMKALRKDGLQQACDYLAKQIESPYKINRQTDTVEYLLPKYINSIHLKGMPEDIKAVNHLGPVAAHVM